MHGQLRSGVGFDDVKLEYGALDAGGIEGCGNDIQVREIKVEQGGLIVGDGQSSGLAGLRGEEPGFARGGIGRHGDRERKGKIAGEREQHRCRREEEESFGFHHLFPFLKPNTRPANPLLFSPFHPGGRSKCQNT
jgi:hypothetical protein